MGDVRGICSVDITGIHRYGESIKVVWIQSPRLVDVVPVQKIRTGGDVDLARAHYEKRRLDAPRPQDCVYVLQLGGVDLGSIA